MHSPPHSSHSVEQKEAKGSTRTRRGTESDSNFTHIAAETALTTSVLASEVLQLPDREEKKKTSHRHIHRFFPPSLVFPFALLTWWVSSPVLGCQPSPLWSVLISSWPCSFIISQSCEKRDERLSREFRRTSSTSRPWRRESECKVHLVEGYTFVILWFYFFVGVVSVVSFW